MITVNGQTHALEGHTVAEALALLEYSKERIALEYNGDILPKASYESTVLKPGDVLEVVRFVGGG